MSNINELDKDLETSFYELNVMDSQRKDMLARHSLGFDRKMNDVGSNYKMGASSRIGTSGIVGASGMGMSSPDTKLRSLDDKAQLRSNVKTLAHYKGLDVV